MILMASRISFFFMFEYFCLLSKIKIEIRSETLNIYYDCQTGAYFVESFKRFWTSLKTFKILKSLEAYIPLKLLERSFFIVVNSRMVFTNSFEYYQTVFIRSFKRCVKIFTISLLRLAY